MSESHWSKAEQADESLCALQCRADVLELDLSCCSHGNTEFKVNALAVGLRS